MEVVNYIHTTIHLRYLTRFWIRPCSFINSFRQDEILHKWIKKDHRVSGRPSRQYVIFVSMSSYFKHIKTTWYWVVWIQQTRIQIVDHIFTRINPFCVLRLLLRKQNNHRCLRYRYKNRSWVYSSWKNKKRC